MKKNIISLIIAIGILLILPIKVSASTLLSSIEVEGIGTLNLSKNSWNLGYSTPYDYVNITATPASEDVTVEGAGKVSVQQGANNIVIKATNGTATESYTINLNVSKKEVSSSTSYDKDGNVTTNPETGAFLNVTLVSVLSILSIAIIYLTNKKQKFFHL